MNSKFIAVLLVTCVTFAVRADTWTDPDTGITWTYSVTNGKASVGGGSSSPAVPRSISGVIEIPSAFGNCAVTSIGASAFLDCIGLAGVTIPDGVTSIGESAFSGCSGLTNMTITSSVTCIGDRSFYNCSGLGSVMIPSSVTNIGEYAFAYCDNLTAVEIPNSVKIVGVGAFAYCNNLKNATIPQCICAMASTDNGIQYSGSTYSGMIIKTSSGVSCVFGCESTAIYSGNSYSGSIEEYPCNPALTNIVVECGTTHITDFAFADCKNLLSATIPASVTRMGYGAFKDCTSLVSLYFEGDAPDVGSESSSYLVSDTPILFGTPRRLKVKVQEGSIGWSGGGESTLPASWCDRAIMYAEDPGGSSGGGNGSDGSGGGGATAVSLTVTNVVVHYVLNSVVPEVAMPISGDTGFVTVVTEIKGGAVAIPESWAANYSGFEDKFGNDFTAALTKPSGKRDAQGNALMVWQDYVAGTDPTKEDDVFQASITIANGVPLISYTPELPPEERAKRNYVTYGKARLQDEEWHVVDGDAANYNFFKVTVEMK